MGGSTLALFNVIIASSSYRSNGSTAELADVDNINAQPEIARSDFE